MLTNKLSPIFIIFIIVISIILLIYIISFFECKYYKITEYNIKNTKTKSKIKIVYLSDFHDKVYGNNNEKLIFDICNKNPDYVLIGGDLIDFSILARLHNKVLIDNAIIFITKLSKKLHKNSNNINLPNSRIIFSFGNHELRLKSKEEEHYRKEYEKFIKCLKDNKVIILDNATIDVGNDITVSGLSIYDGYYTKRFSNEFKYDNIEQDVLKNIFKLDNSKYNILLFHKPDFYEDLKKYGFDLVLSGHNHGGLVRFPIIGSVFSPDLSFMPKYDYGKYDSDNKTLIVSSGLGEHCIKIRVNNRPEFCVINIE